MNEATIRSQLIYGLDGMSKLGKSHVAIFGIGGVGGILAEALARTGIGQLTLIDFDVVDVSNMNRQIWAHTETIGQKKVEAAKDRLNLVAPHVQVEAISMKVTADSIKTLLFKTFDYVVDAVDDVAAKIAIIETAKQFGVPIITSMGAGNKVNPMAFQIADIDRTSVCPLAKRVRVLLRKKGIRHVKALYSTEKPLNRKDAECIDQPGQRRAPGSVMYTVGAAGLMIASEVVADLTGQARIHP